VHARGVDTELGPGDVVGELALLRSDSKRIARVQALTRVDCLAIERSTFRTLLASDVHLAIAVLENVADRVPD
jgi:CRP-like cAMP-binding protein